MLQHKWVVVAELLRPRGIRGEMVVALETSRPEALAELGEVYLLPPAPGAEPLRAEIETAWDHQGRWVLKLRGIDSIEEAEPLRGYRVAIPIERRRTPGEDEFFLSDLVGCEVILRDTGEVLGPVTACQETAGPVLLAVQDRARGAEVLIPFTKAVCVEVDIEARRIRVDLPEGLRELNAP